MNILRWAGGCLWIGCGWFAGDFAAQRTRRHLNDLSDTLRLLRRIQQEITCRRTDLNQLYQTLLREGMVQEMPDITALRQLPPPASFLHPEAECFRECMAGMGRLGAVQECAQLELCIQQLEEYFRQAQQTARTTLELAHKLGLGAGLAVAILLW
mgnify:CR=1 FL=1